MTEFCVYCRRRPKLENEYFCGNCESTVASLPRDYKAAFESVDELRLKRVELELKIEGLEAKLEEKDEKLKFLKLPNAWTETKHEDQDCILETSKGDVIIVQNNSEKVLHAHTFILSSKSPVFQKMFNCEMSGKETPVLRIEDATHPLVVAMVKFCYTCEISFNEEVTPEKLLQVAHKYGIDLLQKVCEKELIETLNEDNLPKRLKLSINFEVKGLQGAAADYFKDNFDSVIYSVMKEMRDPPRQFTWK